MLNKEKCEYILECNWDKTPPVMRHMVEDLIKEHFEHVERVEKQKKLDELQKALDEACCLLEEYGSLTNIYTEDKLTNEEWKERLMKDE